MLDNTKPPPSSKNSTVNCPDFAEIVRSGSTDRSLFEQIAQCFSERLEEFAKYYCKDSTLGQDAFQDAMMATMKYLDTYRGDSPIEPWLRRIVTSSCSRLRRGKKNAASSNIPLDDEPNLSSSMKSNSPDQELRLMLTERLSMVQKEIEKLKEPNRTLLMLHDVEEITIAELMSRYEMTEEAVKSRLKRSRAQVRESLLAALGSP